MRLRRVTESEEPECKAEGVQTSDRRICNSSGYGGRVLRNEGCFFMPLSAGVVDRRADHGLRFLRVAGDHRVAQKILVRHGVAHTLRTMRRVINQTFHSVFPHLGSKVQRYQLVGS